MSDDRTLAELRELRRTAPIRAAALVARLDAGKVDDELRGVRRNPARAGWAIRMINLARIAHGTPSPPSPLPLAPVWRRDGVITRNLSSFSGDLREAAHEAGFRMVAVHVLNTQAAQANLEELERLRPWYGSRGWEITFWGDVGHGTSPTADAGKARQLIAEHDPDGFIAGVEAWAEGNAAGVSTAFLVALGDPGCPLAAFCLSSDTDQIPRNFDYAAWLSVKGSAIMPECYGAELPALTVAAMRGSLVLAGVPLSRVVPAFDVVAGLGPFADYARWPGPRVVWTGDDSQPSTFSRIARP